MPWWLFYGVLTLGTVTTVLIDKRRSGDTLGAVIVLGVQWALSNACHWWVPVPYNQWFPLMDAVTAVGLWLAWRARLDVWRIVLILLFLVDGVIHVPNFLQGDGSYRTRYLYDLTLNLIYLAQLTTVLCGLKNSPLRSFTHVRGRGGHVK